MTVGIQLLCYAFHWTSEIWKLVLDHVKGLLRYSWTGPTVHICFSGCGMGTQNLHFKQVPKDADVAGPETALWKLVWDEFFLAVNDTL